MDYKNRGWYTVKKRKHTRLQPIRLDEYRPLRDLVADALRVAIKDGTLRPGERLMELQLADELGVSRTPIREAVRELEAEGFLVMIPRRGTYVADISLKDIAQVFEIRTALEELAAGLAAERITDDELEELERCLVEIGEHIETGDLEQVVEIDIRFHAVLYEASRNTRLIDIINNLREMLTRFRSVSLHYPGRLQETYQEHRDLVEAIAEHDADLARKIAVRHMENSERTLLRGIAEDENVSAYIHEMQRGRF